MNNTLRLSFHSDPATIDPQECGDKLSSALIFLLYKGLTRLEPDGSVLCDLADHYQIYDHHRKYVFFLGDHVWSDGTSITAHDFVYSWKRALAPSFPLRATNFFFRLKNAKKAKEGHISLNNVGVFAKDDRILEVHLENSCTSFLELVSFCVFFPLPSHLKEKPASRVCSGPFTLTRWTHGKEILLRRNSRCKSVVPVSLDGIHIRIISNPKQAFALFQDNQLDWLGSPISFFSMTYWESLLSSKQIKPLPGITCCWFNTSSSLFSNINLRKAIAYAIPRKELLERLFLPNPLVSTSFNPFSFTSEHSNLVYESNESACVFFQKALKEAKLNRISIALSFEATEEFSRAAEFIKIRLEELFPICIRLEPMHYREFWKNILQRKFQFCIFYYLFQCTDPICFFDRFEFKNALVNYTGWENSEYQALLRKYHRTIDPEKRSILIKKAELILIEGMPVSPLYNYHFAFLQKEHLKNLQISPIGAIRFDQAYLGKRSPIPRIKVLRD